MWGIGLIHGLVVGLGALGKVENWAGSGPHFYLVLLNIRHLDGGKRENHGYLMICMRNAISLLRILNIKEKAIHYVHTVALNLNTALNIC